MEKKIAVFVKDRQEEGLRMALGLVMLHEEVDIIVVENQIEKSGKVVTHLKSALEAELQLFTNNKENDDFTFLTNQEIANRVLLYDVVLKY